MGSRKDLTPLERELLETLRVVRSIVPVDEAQKKAAHSLWVKSEGDLHRHASRDAVGGYSYTKPSRDEVR